MEFGDIDMAYCAAALSTGSHEVGGCGAAGDGAGLDGLFRHFHSANDRVAARIRKELSARYPHIPWADSEDEPDRQIRPEFDTYWICDPIDGAYHFLKGLHGWSSSLALVYGGRAIAAWVYDPNAEELYMARLGCGATLNGTWIRASSEAALEAAVVGTSLPSRPGQDREDMDRVLATIGAVAPAVFAVRMLASSSLQLSGVAAGRLGAHWEFGHDMYDWLAGALIAQEAGAVVTAIDGNTFTWGARGIMAAAPALHAPLQGLIA